MALETRTVLTACADGIATLTLNRPEARNALDMTMRRELEESLARLAGDPQVRVLVVRGAGVGWMAGRSVVGAGVVAGRSGVGGRGCSFCARA